LEDFHVGSILLAWSIRDRNAFGGRD